MIQFSSPVSKIRNRWQYILCTRERINEEEKRAWQSCFPLSPWPFLSPLSLYSTGDLRNSYSMVWLLPACSYNLTKKYAFIFNLILSYNFFFPFVSFIYFCLLIKPNLHSKNNSSSNNNNKAPKRNVHVIYFCWTVILKFSLNFVTYEFRTFIRSIFFLFVDTERLDMDWDYFHWLILSYYLLFHWKEHFHSLQNLGFFFLNSKLEQNCQCSEQVKQAASKST